MIAGQLVRFIGVGLVNTALGYGAILVMQYGVGASPFVANATGYLIGFCVSYLLHSRWTFRSRRAHVQAVPAFVLTGLTAYAVNLGALKVCLDVAAWPGAVAQGVAVFCYSATFFVMSRHVVFRDSRVEV